MFEIELRSTGIPPVRGGEGNVRTRVREGGSDRQGKREARKPRLMKWAVSVPSAVRAEAETYSGACSIRSMNSSSFGVMMIWVRRLR